MGLEEVEALGGAASLDRGRRDRAKSSPPPVDHEPAAELDLVEKPAERSTRFGGRDRGREGFEDPGLHVGEPTAWRSGSWRSRSEAGLDLESDL